MIFQSTCVIFKSLLMQLTRFPKKFQYINHIIHAVTNIMHRIQNFTKYCNLLLLGYNSENIKNPPSYIQRMLQNLQTIQI